jgi:uncharacterized protein (DUF2147 family)
MIGRARFFGSGFFTSMRGAPASSNAAFAAPKDLSGTWLTGDGRAKIRIDRCGPSGGNACGKA